MTLVENKLNYRVALLGESGVGKSAITCRFLFKKFLRDYSATLEDTYHKKMMVDDEVVDLEILDIGGTDEQNLSNSHNNHNKAKLLDREGFIIVFDLSDNESFKRIDNVVN